LSEGQANSQKNRLAVSRTVWLSEGQLGFQEEMLALRRISWQSEGLASSKKDGLTGARRYLSDRWKDE
jgi:hypothetical protein